MILFLTPEASIEILEEFLLPIFICVVLPCIIVWLTLNARKHELDKRTEIALKAIENGAEIDPKILSSVKSKERGLKEKIFGYLKTGIILSAVGIIFLLLGLIMREQVEDAIIAFYSTAALFIVLGNTFFLIYMIAKKRFANEIAKEEAEAGLAQ